MKRAWALGWVLFTPHEVPFHGLTDFPSWLSPVDQSELGESVMSWYYYCHASLFTRLNFKIGKPGRLFDYAQYITYTYPDVSLWIRVMRGVLVFLGLLNNTYLYTFSLYSVIPVRALNYLCNNHGSDARHLAQWIYLVVLTYHHLYLDAKGAICSHWTTPFRIYQVMLDYFTPSLSNVKSTGC